MFSQSFSHCSQEDEGKAAQDLSSFFGPGHVDQTIRQAISTCWMAMPKDKKTVEAVEQEMRRLFERAIKDFRDDAAAFGQ